MWNSNYLQRLEVGSSIFDLNGNYFCFHRTVLFGFNQDARNTFLKALKEKLSMISIEQVFAFANRYSLPCFSQIIICYSFRESFSWNKTSVYDTETEFARQGIGKGWRITNANKNYKLCPTYPKVF